MSDSERPPSSVEIVNKAPNRGAQGVFNAPVYVGIDRSTVHEGLNRKRMLERVHVFWIKGVLEKSLYHESSIVLGLHEQPDLLANARQLVLQEGDQPAHPLPTGTRITQVYDEAHGELLILGEPGCGKTTLLLELTKELINRAQINEKHPIPVVFNLSSWAVNRLSIVEWLIEELDTKYQVPHKVSRLWVETGQVLPLLDGLDEVVEEYRKACVDAINVYRYEHALLPTIVCSRRIEYLAQTGRVVLKRAIVVQPLTPQQIYEYLSSTGGQLETIRVALKSNPDLQLLATSPLLLNVLILAYHGKHMENLLKLDSPEMLPQQIWATYVERMLQRREARPPREAEPRYADQQTVHWLKELAQRLTRQNQMEFYMERMQLDWLPANFAIRLFYSITARICVGLLSGLIIALAVGLGYFIFTKSFELFSPLNLVFGLVGGLLFGLTAQVRAEIKPAEIIVWSWKGLWQGLVKSVSLKNIFIYGLASAAIALIAVVLMLRALGAPIANAFEGSKIFALFALLTNGLFGGILGSISTQRRLVTSRRSRVYSSLSLGLASCLTGVFLIGTWFTLISIFDRINLLTGLYIGFIRLGLPFGLLMGLTSGLIFGLTGSNRREVRVTDFFSRLYTGIHPRKAGVDSIRFILFLGLTPAIFAALLGAAERGLLYSLLAGFLILVTYTIVGRMITLLNQIITSGLSSDILNKYSLIRPNQGIRNSARNSILTGFLFGIIGLVIATLAATLTALVTENALSIPILLATLRGSFETFGLFGGILIGIIVGLSNGGTACIQHFVLRFFLWRTKSLPWSLSQFLDYAADCILLHRVGGGYIFIHRLLLEYFAKPDITPAFNQIRQEQDNRTDFWICECGHREGRVELRYCPKCGRPKK